MTKKCKKCGKDINAKLTFCSKDCWKRSREEVFLSRFGSRPCSQCGAEILIRSKRRQSSDSIFCSTSCQYTYTKEQGGNGELHYLHMEFARLMDQYRDQIEKINKTREDVIRDVSAIELADYRALPRKPLSNKGRAKLMIANYKRAKLYLKIKKGDKK